MDDSETEAFFEDRDIPQSTEYNETRLDYSKPVYRDIFCAIIYYLILALVIGYGVYNVVEQWPQLKQDYEDAKNDITNNVDNPEVDDSTGIFVTLGCCAAIGLIFGFCWLSILRACAKFIIKTMVILSCVLWITVTVIAFIYDEIELGIILAIFTLF
eukprot:773924_1